MPATLLATLCFASPGWSQEDDAATDVPLSRVVLFNSGVGFFEHRGSVDGDASVELKFNVDDVNDLLKSMVVQDLDGGKVSTVTYASKDPITKTLKTFAIDLTENPSLAELLSQVRGARVALEAPNETEGIILGVETRKEKADDETVDVEYLNLFGETGLRSVRLDSISRIQLLDDKLDAELRQALQVLASGNANDKKSVNLQFTGDGQRQVRIGYIQETPVWKTSYRLVLNDDEDPYLQGWAIVENTTENDWENVELSLVSGRPISFIMDLYQPLYVPRPQVQLELYASLVPPDYNQDLGRAEKEFAENARKRMIKESQLSGQRRAGGMGGAIADGGRAAEPSAAPKAATGFGMERLGESVASLAQADDVGELFQYQIDVPVQLERQRSAMLPIISGNVAAEKVSIYNPETHARHPLNGLWLTNSTDLHLMQGPATVYDGSTYAGDTKLPDLPPDSKRLVSYALDLETEVARVAGAVDNQITSLKIVKGTLHVRRELERGFTYTVKNSGDREKTVLIEYPREGGWNLLEPKEPEETTRDEYRFEVAAAPGEPVELKVVERMPQFESIGLHNIDDNRIAMYISAKTISETVKRQLQEVVERKRAIEQVVREKQQRTSEIEEISKEQARIRENMVQLTRNTDLYNRYVKKFNDQEDRIETLREEISELQAKEDQLRRDLDDFLQTLNAE